MPQFLLRVEGVNLVNVIDDTDDLSTRRGGGLMILNASSQMLETIDPAIGERLTPIATGASIGLFSFDATDAADADRLGETVRNHFRTNKLKYGESGKLPLNLGTFVVDVAEVKESAAEAEQLATARNRWRQLSEPSLSLEGLWDDADDHCEFDFSRPEFQTIPTADNPARKASLSVFERRRFGRGARQKFYEQELGKAPTFEFTDDFKELSHAGDLNDSLAPRTTRDKIAVFYVDGNQFGKIGGTMWQKADPIGSFRGWSEAVRQHHRDLLGKLLARIEKNPESWQTPKGQARLETLLWGGDEILWIVPAWKGWELAEWFFGQEHQVPVVDHPLTYGCGLVFCHAKAPIKNITRLTHQLGDAAKAAGSLSSTADASEKQKEAYPGHRIAYEVLESFDDVTGDLDEHRRRWLPKGAGLDQLVLDPVKLKQAWSLAREIARCEDFPTRQLFMLVRAWRKNVDFTEHEKRLMGSAAGTFLKEFREAVGDNSAWLHLLQMRPYLPKAEVKP